LTCLTLPPFVSCSLSTIMTRPPVDTTTLSQESTPTLPGRMTTCNALTTLVGHMPYPPCPSPRSQRSPKPIQQDQYQKIRLTPSTRTHRNAVLLDPQLSELPLSSLPSPYFSLALQPMHSLLPTTPHLHAPRRPIQHPLTSPLPSNFRASLPSASPLHAQEPLSSP
jgi:hypothetical protein